MALLSVQVHTTLIVVIHLIDSDILHCNVLMDCNANGLECLHRHEPYYILQLQIGLLLIHGLLLWLGRGLTHVSIILLS